MDKYIQAPVNEKEIESLQSGDMVYITGTIYTARDAAHKRMYETLAESGKSSDMISRIRYNLLYGTVSGKGRTVLSVLQVRQRPAAWINIHHSFWILGLECE